jgi:hypothetical protein
MLAWTSRTMTAISTAEITIRTMPITVSTSTPSDLRWT